MSEKVFKRQFPRKSIKKSDVELKTYTGEPVKIVGETTIQVGYQDQQPQELTLVIVKGSGPSLLGRNWLQHFRLDWHHIKSIGSQKNSLTALLDEYNDIFADELGTIKPFKAKLSVERTSFPQAQICTVFDEISRRERVGSTGECRGVGENGPQ